MDKEIVLSLINAVKSQKNIMIKHNETFRNYLDVRSLFMMNRILYQGERFKKITQDINSLMKKSLSQQDFELYLETSNKIQGDLLKREESLNKQVEKAIKDFQLNLVNLKDKLLDIDSLLDDLKEKLE